jgi:hypothetical protein
MNFSADAVQNSEVRLDGGELVIKAPKMMTLALKDPGVQRVAAQVLGRPVRLRVEIGENMKAAAPVRAENSPGGDAALRERALAHPGVKRFQEIFPDALVRNVRNLNE